MKLENLKIIRNKKKITMKQLAERSGVSMCCINDLENGYNNAENVKLSTIVALAKALKVRVRDLVNDDVRKYV